MTLRTTILGDGNLLGNVEAADYTIWANGFASSEPDYRDGDYNRDGAVGPADYTIWANNFGVGVPPNAMALPGAAAVPEPSSGALALLGVLTAALCATGLRSRNRPTDLAVHAAPVDSHLFTAHGDCQSHDGV